MNIEVNLNNIISNLLINEDCNYFKIQKVSIECAEYFEHLLIKKLLGLLKINEKDFDEKYHFEIKLDNDLSQNKDIIQKMNDLLIDKADEVSKNILSQIDQNIFNNGGRILSYKNIFNDIAADQYSSDEDDRFLRIVDESIINTEIERLFLIAKNCVKKPAFALVIVCKLERNLLICFSND